MWWFMGTLKEKEEEEGRCLALLQWLFFFQVATGVKITPAKATEHFHRNSENINICLCLRAHRAGGPQLHPVCFSVC